MSARHKQIALLFFVFFAASFALASAAAWAAGGTDAASGKGAPSKEFLDACSQGNSKYMARDFAGAIASYRKAVELGPHQALGHYLLGEAQLAAGDLSEADAEWNRAALDSNGKDPALRARILFVLADLKERQKKWEDAKAAWQVYLDWANRFPAAHAFPGSAQSRQQVIETILKQDRSYDIVRQRIAETKDGGVYTDLSKSPPAGK